MSHHVSSHEGSGDYDVITDPSSVLSSVPRESGSSSHSYTRYRNLSLKKPRTKTPINRLGLPPIQDPSFAFQTLLGRARNRTKRSASISPTQAIRLQTQKVYVRMRQAIGKRWKKNLLYFYDAEKGEHTYVAVDVVDFAKKSSEKKIQNMAQWKQYYRRFTRRSGALVNSGHISEEDESYYLWMGIHSDLRSVLETHIQLRRQLDGYGSDSEDDSDTEEQPYTVAEITSAARHHFKRNRFVSRRFDADRFGQRPSDESSATETDSEGEDTSEDSDNEKQKKKARQEKKKRMKKKEQRKEKKQLERASKMSGSPAELTQLVKQLNGMKPDHESYAPMYYQAVVLDPTGREHDKYNKRTANSHKGRAPAKSSAEARSSQPRFHSCYGCHDPGHRIGECPQIARLLREQKIRRDPETNRLTLNNGNFIRRYRDESMVAAVERIMGTSADVNLYYASDEEDMEMPIRVDMFFAGVPTEHDEDLISEAEGFYNGRINNSRLRAYYGKPPPAERYPSEWDDEYPEIIIEEPSDSEFRQSRSQHYQERAEVYNRTFPAKDRIDKESSGARARRDFMEGPAKRAGLRDHGPRQVIPRKFRDLDKPSAPERPERSRVVEKPSYRPQQEDVPMAPPATESAGGPAATESRVPETPTLAERPPVLSRQDPSAGRDPGQHRTEIPPPPRRSRLDPFSSLPRTTPVDARQPRVRPTEDGQREDQPRFTQTPKVRERTSVRNESGHPDDEPPPPKGRGPAKVAPIARNTNIAEAVDKLMKGRSELTVEETFAISKEAREEMMGRLKPVAAASSQCPLELPDSSGYNQKIRWLSSGYNQGTGCKGQSSCLAWPGFGGCRGLYLLA
ncbi:hypothetical protein BD626DRAFT_543440 [Schizophyllum amplum]|uniref:CCHC-type domain-containing protein n=1 Tax=Schizophyllum amplum TaxID=97359 RepID=A0A550BRQ4_9AGAR|nr:hypothetical protein BD626DRAFT_543440 [Auriculariopsis ampla]